MRYYADSCIWIDFIEDRYEINLFYDCIVRKEELLISDILLEELDQYIHLDDMKMIFQLLESNNLLLKTVSTPKQGVESKRLAQERNIPPGDALHAIIARDNNATLVTRDKHFLKLGDICKVEII
jgi:predicted nucleic acid-binding protein